ncbi:tetratricopeptide repeat protein [Novosphingobium album (ex Liu et al. 2023)]|uniref:Tetratricopeptide repeat protein n=1 Tax=Novosphingobium album (ex Liu et al. 2023) TaxID=3031130 RepID=A0ABT5WNM3_9SPHN|nr:tetratricopeptide repeat protein [Novosphingobium album (ex Liu et al. 2023)]MDE8651652.1 tetratricopeptide repeat protein [Novosphingobium album (ex Liu et al. 2023)]
MTQHAAKTFPAGRILLVIAAMAAAFAIVFAISHRRDPAPEDVPASTAPADATGLIAALEKQTAANPKDGAAWARLGMAYFAQSRFADAVRAYERASLIDPGDAAAWSALGEARVMASARDPMPAAAAQAFEKAVAIDPKDPRARYFLAVRKDLTGDHKGAIVDWLTLLEDTPADAPWRADLVRTIEQVGKINRIDVTGRLAAASAQSPPAARPPVAAPIAAQGIPGPTAQDLAGASRIPPSQQREMAQGMVDRLETRLKGDPANVDGWIMLMRSRMTLGEPDKAAGALAEAVAANPGKADYLRQQAAILGVK